MGELVKLEQLNWGDKMCNLLHSMWLSKTLCDTVIVCRDNSTIRCHKCVVGAASSAMSQVLSDLEMKKDLTPGKEILVRTNIPKDIWEAVLTFMYTGTAVIKPSRMTYLQRVAEKFHISELHDLCEEYEKQKTAESEQGMLQQQQPPDLHRLSQGVNPGSQVEQDAAAAGVYAATPGVQDTLPPFTQAFANPHLSLDTPVFHDPTGGQLATLGLPGPPMTMTSTALVQGSEGLMDTTVQYLNTPGHDGQLGGPQTYMQNEVFASEVINQAIGANVSTTSGMPPAENQCITAGLATYADNVAELPMSYTNLLNAGDNAVIFSTETQDMVQVENTCQISNAGESMDSGVEHPTSLSHETGTPGSVQSPPATTDLPGPGDIVPPEPASEMPPAVAAVATEPVLIPNDGCMVPSLMHLAASALTIQSDMVAEATSPTLSEPVDQQPVLLDNDMQHHVVDESEMAMETTTIETTGVEVPTDDALVSEADTVYQFVNQVVETTPNESHLAVNETEVSNDAERQYHSVQEVASNFECQEVAVPKSIDNARFSTSLNIISNKITMTTNTEPETKSVDARLDFSKLDKNVCRICLETFPSIKRNLEHGKLAHPGEKLKIYYCDSCDKDFQRADAYRKHVEKHVLCEECGKPEPDMRSLQMHKEMVHDAGKPITCESCRSVFKNRNEYEGHVKQCCFQSPFQLGLKGSRRTYTCDTCGEQFNSLVTLSTHIKTHCSEDYDDDDDDAAGSSLSERSNTPLSVSDTPYSTESETAAAADDPMPSSSAADQTFSEATESQSHSQPSPGSIFEDSPVISEDDETASVVSKQNKIKHKRFHCRYCPLKYRTVGSRVRHEILHYRSRRCNICGTEFTTRYFLKRHRYIHHSEFFHRPCTFKCYFCERSFSSANMMSYHTTRHHYDRLTSRVDAAAAAPLAAEPSTSSSPETVVTEQHAEQDDAWRESTATTHTLLESMCKATPLLPNAVDINKPNSNDGINLFDSIAAETSISITDRTMAHHVEDMVKNLKEMRPLGAGDMGARLAGVELMEEDMPMETDYNKVVSSEDPFIPPPAAMNG